MAGGGGAGGAAVRPGVRQHPGAAVDADGAVAGVGSGARGTAILAGLLRGQARAVLAAHRRQGLVLERRIDVGEWTTLVLRRPAFTDRYG